jgi:ureidoglycolate dehydrogenase (NAD+)
MPKFYQVDPQSISQICSDILKSYQVPEEDAEIVSKSLVEADLRGVSSHGVIRLSIYLKRIEKGIMKSNPNIQFVKETQNTAVLDGDYGLGQVVSQRAISRLIQKMKENHLGAIAVRRSNHFGAGAYWAMQLQEHDMIGIAVSNVEPLMAPPGGAAARVGNNPLALAVPAGKEKPIILDMATSVVPLGRIVAAKSKGESIPLGWAVNRLGQATTDPDEVINGGNLFPVGGPKGYGIAVMIDILSALLSGGAIGPDIHSLYQDFNNPNDISHFFMAIRIDAFMDPRVFRESVDRYIQYMKNTPLAPNTNQVYLPGEIEILNKERNLKEGITLPAAVVEEIVSYAKKASVSSDLIDKLKVSPLDE